MSKPTIPDSDTLVERIRACREELRALQRLLRLVRAAEVARAATERNRAAENTPGGRR